MDRHSVRERLATSVYDHKIPVPRELHAVERIRLLFARALDYQPPAGPAEYGLRQNLPALNQGSAQGLLFFHGTARAEKLWPEAHWAELADLAMQQGYAIWLPWGSEQERERAERIVQRCATGGAAEAQVLPRLDLLGLASMLLEVSGAVAVDTGLGHLCAALDVPTVSLYGPTDINLIGAYGRNQAHIQSPVGPADTADPLAMMQSITTTAVWHELQTILPEINQGRCAQPETPR